MRSKGVGVGGSACTVLFNRKQIALHFPVTQIAVHLCPFLFVGNNRKEMLSSQGGIGFGISVTNPLTYTLTLTCPLNITAATT